MNAYQVAIVVVGGMLVLLIVLVVAIAPALRRFTTTVAELRASAARETAPVTVTLVELRRRTLSRGGGISTRRRTPSRGGGTDSAQGGDVPAAAGALAAGPAPGPISPERA